MTGWSADPVERGWGAQEASVAAYDEASTAGWEADFLDGQRDRRTPYRSPWLPTCAYGCRDPWDQDPACDVHANRLEGENQ